MLARFVVVTAALFAVTFAQTVPMAPHRQYATPYMGAEVIDFSAPALAYVTDIRYDAYENATNPRIWFAADKSSPNAYFAQFNPIGGNHSFWATADSPFPAQTASPFYAFDAKAGFVVGLAYSTNYSVSNFNLTGFGPVLQSLYSSYDGQGTPIQYQTQQDNYYFAAIAIDPTVYTNVRYAYLTGWASDLTLANNGLTIARITIGIPNADIGLAMEKDVIPGSRLNTGNCYDVFTASYKPFIFVNPNATTTAPYVIYVIPGRCSMIYKTVIPTADQGLVNATLTMNNPLNSSTEYISSAALDETNHILWITVKTYQQAGVYIRSLNVATMTLTTENTAIDFGEYEPLIQVGNDFSGPGGKNITRYLYVAASGGDKVYRYTVKNDGTGVTALSGATLAPRFNQVSSMTYIRPYLYFGTYEPNAQLVRIHKNSFCFHDCTANSYCNTGVCVCVDGYVFDPNTKDENGNNACVPSSVKTIEVRATQETGAAAALGVLWAFSLVIGIAGWYLWWRARAAAHSAI